MIRPIMKSSSRNLKGLNSFKNKNVKKLHLLILLIWGLTACTKEEPQNQQRVIDSITKTPIANAKVELTIDESTDIFGGNSRRLVETVYTDNEGRYEFTEPINTRDGYYELFVFVDRYFDITSGQGYDQNKLVELSPEGYLKVRIQRIDTIGIITCTFNGYQHHEFSGSKIDTTIIDIQPADLLGSYRFWFSPLNEFYDRQDSLFIPRHDTIHYEIIF